MQSVGALPYALLRACCPPFHCEITAKTTSDTWSRTPIQRRHCQPPIRSHCQPPNQVTAILPYHVTAGLPTKSLPPSHTTSLPASHTNPQRRRLPPRSARQITASFPYKSLRPHVPPHRETLSGASSVSCSGAQTNHCQLPIQITARAPDKSRTASLAYIHTNHWQLVTTRFAGNRFDDLDHSREEAWYDHDVFLE